MQSLTLRTSEEFAMKQRSFVLSMVAMMPLAAAVAQQTPPVAPPTTPPPASPALPVERARPMVAPLPAISGQLMMDPSDRQDIRRMSEEPRRIGEEARRN